MSKTKLSTLEVGAINEILKGPQIAYLKKFISTKFSLGDVLIKKTYCFDDDLPRILAHEPSKTELELMENSILPQRYKVIHVDEDVNVAFLKKIKIDGKLDSKIESSSDIEELVGWGNFSYFEVDSQFTDATIFGEEFDVSSILKEETDRRDRIVKMNMAAAIEMKSLRDVEKFIKELKDGDVFYYHEGNKKDYYSGEYGTFDFGRARKYTVASRVDVREWKLNLLSKNQLNSKCIYSLRSKRYNSLLRSSYLVGMVVFKTKPMSLDETE